MKKVVQLLLLGLVVVSFASAAIIPQLPPGSITAGSAPGQFQYTYDVQISGDQRLDPANDPHMLTIYDFAGYVAGTAFQPTDWVFVGAFLTGNVSEGVCQDGRDPASPTENFEDDATAYNLVWMWIGTEVAFDTLTQESMGAFGAESIYDTVRKDAYQGLATKDAPGSEADGTLVFNEGNVEVPFTLDTPIPEPSTYLMMAGGFAALALLRRRKSA